MKALNENIFHQYNKWKTGYVRKENSLQMRLQNFINNHEFKSDLFEIEETSEKTFVVNVQDDYDNELKINDKVLVVHFEKGFIEYEGIYSVINNEFCKSQLGKCNFVNREEDMNIPGLRKSKLSYKPRILLKKYSAILEE